MIIHFDYVMSDFSEDGDFDLSTGSLSEDEQRPPSPSSPTPKKQQRQKAKVVSNGKPKTKQPAPRVAEDNTLFHEGYEGYFDQHKQRSTAGSTPFTRVAELSHAEYVGIVQDQPARVREVSETLEHSFSKYYAQWALELDTGFSNLFYGIGSKRRLIMDFLEWWDPDGTVIVANGYNPATTLKEIVKTATVGVVDPESAASWPRQPSERIPLLLNWLENTKQRLILVIHNLDGHSLRDDKARVFLSRIAESPWVTIVASVDHINSPLLYSENQRTAMNFCWHHTPTLAPYTLETAYENVLGLGRNQSAMGARGVGYVLQSLTSNARALFQNLVTAQYEKMVGLGIDDPNTIGAVQHGIPMDELYDRCVRDFVVSSELNFKVLLTEFFEHKMAERLKNRQGREIVFVPYALDELQQIIEDMA